MNGRPSIEEIGEEAFSTALEILQLVELIEKQNTGRINGNLSDSGAGRAAETVRNSMISRLVLLVAGAFAPTRPGDRHLRKGFEEVSKPSARNALNKPDPTTLNEADALWQTIQSDPRMATIKHFRDKFTAHSAHPLKGVPLPEFGETFEFARALAKVMEKFALGVGAAPENRTNFTSSSGDRRPNPLQSTSLCLLSSYGILPTRSSTANASAPLSSCG
jgi:hypothetical protein